MLSEFNRVIDYVDEHLTDDLTLEAIAQYARVSDYHFRKIFFYLSGMTLAEYIKSRRLSEANKDLLSGETVTAVAMKYGYTSVDGFTRAFKKWSGFLPSAARKKRISKVFPKLFFAITIKGGVAMECRIEEKDAFNFVGISKRVPIQFEGVNNEIVELAKQITEKQRAEMHALQNVEPRQVVNISYDADEDFLKEEGCLTHMIGVLTTLTPTDSTLETLAAPACTWAVFPNEGPFPSTLQDTMARAYAQWLPASGYTLIKAPMFSFTKMDGVKGHAASEVWIPVKR